MTGFDDITSAIAGAVARVTLARPARIDACRDQTVDQILAALRLAEAGRGDEVQAAIGRFFQARRGA